MRAEVQVHEELNAKQSVSTFLSSPPVLPTLTAFLKAARFLCIREAPAAGGSLVIVSRAGPYAI